MKVKTKTKISILIVLGVFYALSVIILTNFTLFVGYNSQYSEYSDRNLIRKNLQTSAILEKIHIIGDAGWVDFKNAGNCTGSGTSSDPYLIKDLTIDGKSSGICILIENSDVHFRIENCVVTNSAVGIRLQYVDNAQLINNDCSSNGDGISVYHGDNIKIAGNIANNNYENGLDISACSRAIISGNIANNNTRGLDLFLYSGVICENTANNNNYNGISLKGGPFPSATFHGLVYENTVNNNNLNGMRLYRCDGEIRGNIACHNNEYGFDFTHCNNTLIWGNIVNYNVLSGMRLEYSHNNAIFGNTANFNNLNGIDLAESNENEITLNIVNGNRLRGITLFECSNTIVSGNTLLGNEEGFDEHACEGTIPLNNICLNRISSPQELFELIFTIGIISIIIGGIALFTIRRKRKLVKLSKN